MDYSAHIQQLRHGLLHNRKYAAIACVLVLGFWVITLAGGYLLVRHAMDDSHTAVSNVVNVPTKVGLLFSFDDRSDVVNNIVFFNDVHLQAGPTADLYYAVGAAGNRVLVSSQGSKSVPENGQVDIKGTVRYLPTSYTLKKKWKLTKEEIKAAREQGIYIEADQITAQPGSPDRVARK
jgi:hypothetical protein